MGRCHTRRKLSCIRRLKQLYVGEIESQYVLYIKGINRDSFERGRRHDLA